MTRIERWVVFFALGNQPEYSEIIAEITKHQEGIAVANEILLNISQDPDERARFRSRRIWLQDREHEHAVWKEECHQEASMEYESLLINKDAEIRALRAQLKEQQAIE